MPRPKGSKNRPPAVPRPGYSTFDVLSVTSASESNLKHWTNVGIITADIDSGKGRGTARQFSPRKVVEVELCAAIHELGRGDGLPLSVMRGALEMFRLFHKDAVAFFEEYHELPLVTEPQHRALFPDRDSRQWHARSLVSGTQSAKGEWIDSASLPSSVMQEWMQHRRTHGPATDAQLAAYAAKPDHRPDQLVFESAMERALQAAEIWAQIRTGSFNRGVPDSGWSHFLGLFVREDSALVELDPPAALLRNLIEHKAIVIDLANIVFQIGLRLNKLSGHIPGSRWELGAW